MSELKIPTEIISLPSKGLLYPKNHPLSSGNIEMRYMSAREEDILTNSNFIKQGIVIDKLLQALIVTDVKYDDILIGDKNAIMIAARILGYGKDYSFVYSDESGNEKKGTVDLSELKEKEIDEELYKNGNEFSMNFPETGNTITFKLLTHGDDKNIDLEIKGLKKLNPNESYDVTTRLKYIITSINGLRDTNSIRSFIDKNLLASEARALRKYYNKVSPDVDLRYYPDEEGYTGEGIAIQIGPDFFWPDLGV